jgi:integrase
MEIILKNIPQEKTAQKIHDLTIKLQNSGLDVDTVTCIGYKLSKIDRETDLNDPAKVANYIATLKHPKTGKDQTNASKEKYVQAYQHYVTEYGLTWIKPKYKIPENIPLIPTREEVRTIIEQASEKYIVIFTIETETGASPEELHLVTRNKINEKTGEISITGVKGHGSKVYKLTPHTADLLRIYLAKYKSEQPFPHPHVQSQMFLRYKTQAAEKLHKPELMRIQLRNLRNYSGEQYYKHMPIRDPIGVMQHFRHKKLETTMHYLRAMIIEDDEWISLITHSPEEECKAIEKGYQLVRTINETTAIYRKRK